MSMFSFFVMQFVSHDAKTQLFQSPALRPRVLQETRSCVPAEADMDSLWGYSEIPEGVGTDLGRRLRDGFTIERGLVIIICRRNHNLLL